MRKLLLALLFAQPLSAMATIYPCVFLDIRIKNQLQSTCQLAALELISGSILYKNINRLPISIAPGQLTAPFTISELNWDENADLSLTYDCGENKRITIESEKGLCRRNAVVQGTVLLSQNMNATYDATNGLYWGNQPATITWTLTEAS